MKCVSCHRGALEVFEEQCETCFNRDKIQPLVELRRMKLQEVADVNALLSGSSEKLARSSRHNLNLAFNCVCGSRFKTGLDLIQHLTECEGPKAPTARSNGHAKLMSQDFSDVTEIG